jgi:SAM-dependent methyltransferase
VSQNIDALVSSIEGSPPFTILDFGCGPGRDLKAFSALGHIAIGLEGSARFAEMARAYSGCEVWQQDFLRLDLPQDRFDGVFANASLFHVPRVELPRVPGGIAGRVEAARRALRVESARQRRRGLEPRTLWGLSQAGDLASLRRRRGLRGSRPLLSAGRIAEGRASRGSRRSGERSDAKSCQDENQSPRWHS